MVVNLLSRGVLYDMRNDNVVGPGNAVNLLCRHGSGLSPHPLLVVGPVLTEAGVGLGLGGILDVGVVQEILDS